jgi:hypothetical protein
MTTVSADRDFVSIGQVAAQAGRTVRRVEQAATELGMKPAMRVDGRPYFDGRQVEQLSAKLNRSK